MSVKSWISVESMSVKAWIYFTGNLGARNVLLDENNRTKVADFSMALSDKYPHDNFYVAGTIFDKRIISASDV